MRGGVSFQLAIAFFPTVLKSIVLALLSEFDPYRLWPYQILLWAHGSGTWYHPIRHFAQFAGQSVHTVGAAELVKYPTPQAVTHVLF